MVNTSILLQAYGQAQRSGLLKSSWFQHLFQTSYFAYKRFYEDPFCALGKRFPSFFAGGHVLDIGANIGYTAHTFSQLINPSFKVFAFEPEPENFALLQKVQNRRDAVNKIVPLNFAVGNTVGEVALWLNEAHHADHRIITDTFGESIGREARQIAVPITTIDAFVENQSNHFPVSFIKIDVQGYELQVCHGMERTLAANPRAIVAFEYSPESLEQLGFPPEHLLEFFLDKQFQLYTIDRNARTARITNSDTARLTRDKPYVDIVATMSPLTSP